MNQVGLRMLEISDLGELLNRPLAGFFEGEVRQAAEQAIAQARRGECGRFQYVMRTASGVAEWWDAVVTPITDASGAVVQLLSISRDITERRREEALHAAQHQVLEMIATGRSLPTCWRAWFDSSRTIATACCAPCSCSMRTGSASGMAPPRVFPTSYLDAINGLTIGPATGSCGTAMYWGRRVIVTDILTDPLWENYRDVASAVRTARVLVHADLFAAAQGARIVCDVLPGAARAARRRSCG